MTDKSLFIGTSFLGAIKQGVEHVRPNKSDLFVGFIAPTLAHEFETGWSIDNDGVLIIKPELECFVSGADYVATKHSGNRTFPIAQRVKGISIRLKDYKNIVFVDMFHRIRTAFNLDETGAISYLGVPISRTLMVQLQIQGFNGWVSLSNHPVYGSVPFRHIQKMLASVRSVSMEFNVVLVAAPRPPHGQIDVQKIYGCVDNAKSTFTLIEKFYTDQMNNLGVRYLAQPTAVLDSDLCFTAAQFSRGPHPSIAGMLDEHMTQAYGEIIAEKLYESLLG